MDLLVVPGKTYSMENWGLLTFDTPRCVRVITFDTPRCVYYCSVP